MHGIGAGPPCRIDQRGNVQIALRRRRGADRFRLIGGTHMRRPAIGVREDGDGYNPHLSAGANDPEGDLAAVGDEQPLDQRRAHAGFSLARKARRPSWPSDETRCEAMAAVVMAIASRGARPHTLGMSALDAATPVGAADRISSRYLSTSVSSATAATTLCTSPISFARAASKRIPVRNSSRAADGPIFGRTYGEITAGRMPSLVSVNPNTAASSAIAMSQMAARPAPPPSAAP